MTIILQEDRASIDTAIVPVSNVGGNKLNNDVDGMAERSVCFYYLLLYYVQ